MNKETYKYIFSTYGRDPWLWFGFGAVLLQSFIVRIYTVIALAQVAANVAAGNIDAAKGYILRYLVAFIAGSIIGAIGELVCIRHENEQYRRLMIVYHKKLVNKDMAFYRDNQTGYLASAFRQHLDAAMLLLRFWRGEAMATTMSLTMPAVVLLIVAPKVGLVAAGVIAVQIVYLLWSSARVNFYRAMAQEIYRRITAEVSDEITNIVAFKSSGVEEESQSKISLLARQETETYWLRRRITTFFDFPRNIITGIGVALAVYIVVIGANPGDPASLGLIVLTLTYMFQIIRNVGALPELITTHDDLVTKLHSTLRYLGTDYESIRDPGNPKSLHISNAAIDFNDISFSYPSHGKSNKLIPVFDGLSIHINGGEQVGIVGLSGAGKSTLANLLLRFDEVHGGSISIDDSDIREVRQSELRRNIAYVPQEPLLFHRSIKENIAYYQTDVSDKQVVQAAKAAHAHEFISKLPDGYDTVVGERGVKLSGGQKQRVAIARAVLKKAPIILFDEATSALDSESEQIIQKALPEILGKQTAIIVAHRLSTIAGLDRIIVLDNGKIIEQGTHAQLLKQKGRYYSLWQKQTRGEGSAD